MAVRIPEGQDLFLYAVKKIWPTGWGLFYYAVRGPTAYILYACQHIWPSGWLLQRHPPLDSNQRLCPYYYNMYPDISYWIVLLARKLRTYVTESPERKHYSRTYNLSYYMK
jgi:hypothetical protein